MSDTHDTAPTGEPASVDPNLRFEEALANLERIISRIESGQAGLEEALSEYERGVGLIRHCRGILDRAEQKVEDLTQRMNESSKAAKQQSSK
jgi:exodeoxyribonuclease VII small subunit